MSLLINQGQQDTSKDNYSPIVEKDVLAEIVEIKLAPKDVTKLEITFKILTGTHKDEKFWDRIGYTATDDFSWKYRQLRKAAGCPYVQGENPNIDIEAMLLHKAVVVDLSEQVDKTDATKKYQRTNYKPLNQDSEEEPFQEIPMPEEQSAPPLPKNYTPQGNEHRDPPGETGVMEVPNNSQMVPTIDDEWKT